MSVFLLCLFFRNQTHLFLKHTLNKSNSSFSQQPRALDLSQSADTGRLNLNIRPTVSLSPIVVYEKSVGVLYG